MAITYNAGTNTITVTGYTEAVPCTFLDVYNADVAGGWGVVSRQCTNQYCLSALLNVGDGSTVTWFADENICLALTAAVSPNFSGLIRSRINAHFRLGRLVDAGDKTTDRGCSVINKSPSSYPNIFGYVNDYAYGHNIELYDTILYTKETAYPVVAVSTTNLKTYNCTLNGYITVINNTELYKIRFHGSGYSDGNIEKATGTLSMEDVEVTDGGCLYGSTSASVSSATVKNGLIKNSDGIASLVQNAYDNHFINIDADTWHFIYLAYTGKAYRQYEFDLKVQDKDGNAINGATVKIWDKDDNLVADTTTNASGVIATQTLNYGYYNEAGGDTPTMQTPHKIQIRKDGTNYLTYETDFTINKKTDWVIMMVDMSDLIDEINANEVKIDAGFEDVKVRIDDLEVFVREKQ